MSRLMICDACKDCTISKSIGRCLSDCSHPIDALEEFTEMKKKQEQGLIISLPCKVGDVVYFPIYDYHDSAIIETIRIEENGVFFDWVQYEVGVDCTEVWDNGTFTLEMVGKSVFLTRSEAEEALAKMGGKQ